MLKCLGTTHSPSPRPSPRGEGEAPPDPRTSPGHTIRRPIDDDPPSPCLPSRSVLAKAGGEGRGEGEWAAHRPTGSSGGDACKVQRPLPLFLESSASAQHFQPRQFHPQACISAPTCYSTAKNLS